MQASEECTRQCSCDCDNEYASSETQTMAATICLPTTTTIDCLSILTGDDHADHL